MLFLKQALISSLKKLLSSKKKANEPDVSQIQKSKTFTKEDIAILSGYLPHFAIVYGINTKKSVMMIPIEMLPQSPKPILEDHNGISYSTLN